MKKIILTTLLLVSLIVQSQAQVDLTPHIEAISKELKQVKTIDFTLDQSISRVSGTMVKLEVRKTDTKGKSSSESYKFSLADINASGVRDVLEGKIMVVEVPVLDNDRYIEHTKGAEVVGYESKFRIDVNDVDNARALADVIKKAATEAAPLEQAKYNYTTLDQVLAELYLSVKTSGDDLQMQKLKSNPDKKEKLNLFVQKKGKVMEMFEFNLSDIDPSTVEVKVFGRSITVVATTNADQKVVKVFENDLAKTYVARVTFFPSDIENAKHIKKLLGLAIQATKGNLASIVTPTNNGAVTAVQNETADFVIKSDVPEPDFSLRPYLVTIENTLKDLERTDASSEEKAVKMGYGGMETNLVSFNATSPIRFKQTMLPKIIIKIDGNVDPAEVISVVKAEINKGNRKFAQTSSTMTGKAKSVSNVNIAIAFKKIRNNIFEVTFPDGLQPGEYGFIPNTSVTKTKISCFGID